MKIWVNNLTKRQNVYFVSLFLVFLAYSNYSPAQSKEANAKIDSIQKSVQLRIAEKDWSGLYDRQYDLFAIGFQLSSFQDVYPLYKKNHDYFPNDSPFKPRSVLILAYMSQMQGFDVGMFEHYQYCIKEFTKSGPIDKLIETYEYLGVHYLKLNDHDSAIKNFKACLLLLEDANSAKLRAYYTSKLIAAYYYNEEYIKAKALLEPYENNSTYDTTYYNYQMSYISLGLGNIDDAKKYLQQANKFNNGKIVENEILLIHESEIYIAEGNYSEAIQILRSLENRIIEINDTRELGKFYLYFAEAYKGLLDWDNFYSYLDKSWAAFCQGAFAMEDFNLLTQHNYLYHEIYIPETLKLLSDYYEHKFNSTGLEKFRVRKVDCIDKIVESLNYKRSFLTSQGSRQKMTNLFASHYEEFIVSFLNWYEDTKDIKYLNKAIELSQHYSSFQLKQYVNERVLLKKCKIDSIVIDQYFKMQLDYNQNSIEVDRKFTEEGFEKFKKSEKRYNDFKDVLSKEYIEYEQSKNQFTVKSIQQIQNNLNDQTAIIKYFRGKENLVSYVITSKDVKYFIHNNVARIGKQAIDIRDQILNYSIDRSNIDSMELRFMQTSYELSTEIILDEISSLPDKIEKLIIIPSGELKQIPFESLAIKPGQKWSNFEFFLLKEFAISYAYYCEQAVDKRVSKELKKVLAFGLEYDDFTLQSLKQNKSDTTNIIPIDTLRSGDLTYTYFADDEAIAVAELLDGEYFVNEQATKSNFINNVSNYDILHISAHSFVDIIEPEKSSIILHKNQSETDNLIKMNDVLELNLDGQFVTLSACNTFFGKSNEGEGLESIAKSFTEAGAGTVVGSLWPVPDEISKSFMTSFYTHLKEGFPKDEALRAAKIQFLKDDNLYSPMYRAPFYWSAWVLYGNTDQLVRPTNTNYYKYIFILVMSLLILIYFKRVKKKET